MAAAGVLLPATLAPVGGCCDAVARRRTAGAAAGGPGTGVGGGPGAGAPDRLALPAEEPIVAVRLGAHRGPGDAPITIRAADGGRLRLRPDGRLLEGAVEVRRERERWVLVGRPTSGGPLARPILGGDGPSLAAADGGTVEVDGTPYPGAIRVHRVDADDEAAAGDAGRATRRAGDGRARPARDRLALVNDVPLDAYLPGVLAGELFGHWHPETFAAQAVAARSYACAEAAWNRRADGRRRRAWDLVDTTRSQVYRGARVPPRALEAVARTRGLVLAWDGALVQGYYSAACGGRAARARDVIGAHPANAIAPLDGRTEEDRCCEGAPRYAWSFERARDDVERSLCAWSAERSGDPLAGLERLVALRVARRNVHGRPVAHAVEGRDLGSRIVDAEDLRRALAAGAPAGARPHSGYLERAAVDGGRVTIAGHGHGHGAGLCQYGAQSMARRGRPFERIVGAYYPGATLHAGWTAATIDAG